MDGRRLCRVGFFVEINGNPVTARIIRSDALMVREEPGDAD